MPETSSRTALRSCSAWCKSSHSVLVALICRDSVEIPWLRADKRSRKAGILACSSTSRDDFLAICSWIGLTVASLSAAAASVQLASLQSFLAVLRRKASRLVAFPHVSKSTVLWDSHSAASVSLELHLWNSWTATVTFRANADKCNGAVCSSRAALDRWARRVNDNVRGSAEATSCTSDNSDNSTSYCRAASQAPLLSNLQSCNAVCTVCSAVFKSSRMVVITLVALVTSSSSALCW
mmetsp:Transcript_48301/g.105136  ORF Transcript_48301/g.105136 Transcript_48301/m.105136 type:complete len:237 (-) Transcript_48301:393-1103(-)